MDALSWRFQGPTFFLQFSVAAEQEIKRLPNALFFAHLEGEAILGKPPKINLPMGRLRSFLSSTLPLLFTFLSSLCFPTQSFFTVNRTLGSDTFTLFNSSVSLHSFFFFQ